MEKIEIDTNYVVEKSQDGHTTAIEVDPGIYVVYVDGKRVPGLFTKK